MSENAAGPRMKKARNETADDVHTQQAHQRFHLLQLNDDIFLVLFFHLTHLLDAFNLGITCHRLYKLYRKSLADRRSLLLYREGYSIVEEFGHIFEATTSAELTEVNHICSVLLPTNTSASATFFSHLFVCLPNLVSLELVDLCESELSLPGLLTALRTSPQISGRLQMLTLALIESGEEDIAYELPPLELPALKHLTLYLHDSWSHSAIQLVLSSALLHSVMPQLSSFCLYANSDAVSAMEFIDKHVLTNAQLAASIGTQALQIALDVSEDMEGLDLMRNDEYIQALACVTSFWSIQDLYYENLYSEILPRLISLKEVIIDLGSYGQEAEEQKKEWYPQVLTALATLPQLKEMFISIDHKSAISTDTPRWAKRVMPILPSLRSFSISFSSSVHVNLVEAFHLAHCFPGLQQLSVSFWQYKCEFCDYKDGGVDALQKCALRMALDILPLGTGTGWQAQVKVKELTVSFPHQKVKFSSLENLVAGIKDE